MLPLVEQDDNPLIPEGGVREDCRHRPAGLHGAREVLVAEAPDKGAKPLPLCIVLSCIRAIDWHGHTSRGTWVVDTKPFSVGSMGAGGQRSPCVTASRDPKPATSARRVSRPARGVGSAAFRTWRRPARARGKTGGPDPPPRV